MDAGWTFPLLVPITDVITKLIYLHWNPVTVSYSECVSNWCVSSAHSALSVKG